jgi:hypothetical protein
LDHAPWGSSTYVQSKFRLLYFGTQVSIEPSLSPFAFASPVDFFLAKNAYVAFNFFRKNKIKLKRCFKIKILNEKLYLF